MKIGLLPLARPTFDVAYAEEKLGQLLARLDATEHHFTGPRELLFDGAATRAALITLKDAGVDRLLVLQVTFTDAEMVVEAAATGLPLSIWAVPEPRLGGRLRLNAFCGLNLASHALSRNGHVFSWAYSDADAVADADLDALLTGASCAGRLDGAAVDVPPDATVIAALHGARIARIGAHPPGFDTCAYDSAALAELAGIEVDEITLDTLFETARTLGDPVIIRARAAAELIGLEQVDQTELDRSFRLKSALDYLRQAGQYDAFAIRCWPETFTEYGGAICGPVGMMGQDRIPCACEVDVYGALSQLILQKVADAPVFLADLVDMDAEDDTGVVWHCGQAPLSMCSPDVQAEATIHTNRRMPLLYQFPLKPGRVTLMRISQAFNTPRMVLAGAEMLARAMAFAGTSGVLRFDRPVAETLPALIAGGVEHHLVVAFGDHLAQLRQVAAALNLPVLELTA